MASKEIDNIILEYDETFKIERIELIIKRNLFLFKDYQGKTISFIKKKSYDTNVFYIDNFDDFFSTLLKKIIQCKPVINSLNQPELLPLCYLTLLIKQAKRNGIEISKLLDDNQLSDDVLWFSIAFHFFDAKTQFEKILAFLKYHENEEQIFEWLRKNERFTLYNYFLKLSSDYLKEYDPSFLENINELILSFMDNYIETAISFTSSPPYDLPTLSLEDFESIFLGFLKKINAPKEWQDLFFLLKKENRILFVLKQKEKNDSKYFKDVDGIWKINISTDGTILFFISFVHEFMHFISSQENANLFFLSEFPSIYYEKIAALYLIQIGFDKNIINTVIQNRDRNNLALFEYFYGVLHDINEFNQTGEIKREHQIMQNVQSIEKLWQIKPDLSGNAMLSQSDIEKMVDQNCDSNTLEFIKNGLSVLEGYQYLIGSRLANALLEKKEWDETILNKMIYVTEHLQEFNIESILKFLDTENAFNLKLKNIKL